ncbi:CpaF family protein [Myxococcota bacterium]
MALKERLQRMREGLDTPSSSSATTWTDAQPDAYHDIKAELHRRLIDKLDLKTLEKLSTEEIRSELRSILSSIVSDSEVPLNRAERERMIQELIDEVTGLGPLEPLLRDSSISDILVNTYSTVYIERRGQLSLTPVRFRDNDHLKQIINRIVSRVGRRIDETSPMVDARLPDGSRVNAIIPPLAVDGALLSIRRFGETRLRIRDLMALGTLDPGMIGFLGACVKAKVNMLVSGGTGTGKTTLLNALSVFIPETERIVTIEDAAELQLQQRHVVRLETRPPNIEGKGEVLARELVRNSLRMRPDRIIVGEVRSSEVLDMLQAMNTGHEGSLTTVHANSPRDALIRLESMVGMSGIPLSENVTRQIISRGIQAVAHLTRGTDGRRRLTSISEITGVEGPVITMQEIYKFEQTGVDDSGRLKGDFVPTGVRPHIMTRIEQFGIDPAEVAEPYLGA